MGTEQQGNPSRGVGIRRLRLLVALLVLSPLGVAHSADRVWALHCELGSVKVAGELHLRSAVDLGLLHCIPCNTVTGGRCE